jgi:putative ABC transport system permease protein
MIRFMLKGLLRDRHRSLFPFVVVSLGVGLAVLTYCFIHGMVDDTVRSNANLETGHVKIMTRGYHAISSQIPNDLAILNLADFLAFLESSYPRLDWAPRVKFGGLLDLPDDKGETRAQGPAMGLALDLLGKDSEEAERLNLGPAIQRGRLPARPGEILVSEEFARRLGARIGETATVISSTAYGAMAVRNFVIAGTVKFGIRPLDRNTVIADLAEAGIRVWAHSKRGVAEEAPGAYKDVDRVVAAAVEAGITRAVARLRPMAVVKG